MFFAKWIINVATTATTTLTESKNLNAKDMQIWKIWKNKQESELKNDATQKHIAHTEQMAAEQEERRVRAYKEKRNDMNASFYYTVVCIKR